MKNFNLLQIVPSLESGGVERGTVDLANFLGKNNVGSYVASNGGKMLTLLNSQNTNHIKLPVNSKNIFIMPFIAKELNKIILNKDIDAVHIRSRAPAWILKFIKIKKFKSISTFHNVYGSQNLLKKIYNKALSNVDYIVAISDYVKSTIVSKYKIDEKKITVINRGVDINLFNPEINNQNEFHEFLIKYDIDNENKIILYPGRLTHWKGQAQFLEIIQSYKNSKIICYFVGDDKNKSFLKKFLNEIKNRGLENNCKILGHLPNNDLKMMYKCADVIISAPIKPEGFGRVVSESLAMEKIILCYNYGGVKNQLNFLDKIYKVNPYDQKEMKNRIDEVFKLSSQKKIILGKLSRKHVIENFSNDQMLNSYLNFYRNTVL